MALRMPRPIAHASGVFHLNIRVPSDLAGKVRGTAVTLPLGDAQVTVKPSDKVILSLRTRDPGLAKARFSAAEQALLLHWDAVRRGPAPLTHKQLVALAGECYRAGAERLEADPDFVPDGYLRAVRQSEVDVACWRHDPEDGYGDIGERDATILAALARPYGPQLLAYELGRDIDEFGVAVSYDAAVADLFGTEADELCRVRHLVLDAATRQRLVREVAQAYRLLDRKLLRNVAGDYSPDVDAARFPTFVPPRPQPRGERPRPSVGGPLGVAALFERRRERRGPSVAPATIRRYAPSIASLDAFTKGKDVRSLSEEDIWTWAEHRVKEGASAKTVNRNDLVAVTSVLKWATTRDGGRLRDDNPAEEVKLEEPKRRIRREKTFRAAEISAILRLARSVAIGGRFPRASAGRRWAPWICAYSGTRIQEVLHLTRDDVWNEAGVWVMRFPETKDGFARVVPIHEHLIEEGLLHLWRAAPPGHLFMFDRAPKADASRSPQEMRASEIADWIQTHVGLDDGVSPNHAWRHCFSTNAEAARIPKRISTAITGHNKVRDAADGYVSPSVAQLATAMDRFPRYAI